MADDFKILIITPEEEIPNEAEKITSLLISGADYVHVRKPRSTENRIDRLIESIPRELHSRLSLHGHHHLAVKYGCGIHLNSTENVSDIPASIKRVSKSCHSAAEAAACRNMSYVTLSPIFDSISKHGYLANAALSHVDAAALGVPVIALGGVTCDNLDDLRQSGFAGGALLGAVWQSLDSFNKTVSFLRRRNSRLQFITDGTTADETVNQARQAIAGGCRWIQIRMKGRPEEAISEAAIELLALCRSKGVNLLLNDNVELSCQLGVDGVHIGQTDMPPSEARRLLGDGSIIGLTANTLEHLADAMKQPVDYFGIGPYRFTTTKKRLAPTLGIEGYRKFVAAMNDARCRLPFVAIGGITPTDIAPLAEAGVPGIAISGAIAHSSDPIEATRLFMKEINKYIKI